MHKNLILDIAATGHHPEWQRLLAGAMVGDSAAMFSHAGTEGSGRESASDALRTAVTEVGPGGRLTLLRLNSLLLPLLGGALRGSGVALAGIWFGPQSAALVYGGSPAMLLRGLWELQRMRRLKRVAGLKKLWLLNDARTAAFIQRIVRLPEGVHRLADPIIRLPKVSATELAAERTRLGIAADQRVFAVLGAMREGKFGNTRAHDYGIQPGNVVLVAGEVLDGFGPKLQRIMAGWEQEGVRVVADLRRLDEASFARCLGITDTLWLPYKTVYGSSGMLGHAAACGKPVVASRGGLLGALVREYGLDRADPAGAARYCADNAPEKFVAALLG